MRVVRTEAEYVFEWAELAKEFVKEAIDEYQWGCNEDDLHTTYHLWDKDYGFLLEHKGKIIGCLAGMVSSHFFDYSNQFFSEYMWYVRPEHRNTGGGLMLYRALVKRCEERNIKRIVMGHTKYMKEDFDKLYKKLGFTYLQTHYERVL